MRSCIVLFLIMSFVASSSYAADEALNGFSVEASGTDESGQRVTFKSAFVQGLAAYGAAQAAINYYRQLPGQKELVVSTDDQKNPVLKTVGPQINEFPDAPKFFFSGTPNHPLVQTFKSVQLRTSQAFTAMKDDPVGVFVLLAMTAMNTVLYIDFVSHPDFVSVGVPAIITFLGNALYMKSSLFKPVYKIKEKVTTIAKKGEYKVSEALRINTEAERYEDYREAFTVGGLYVLATYLFMGLTNHNFGVSLPVLGDGVLNGLFNAPLISVVRRWQREENPPLTDRGIDWVLRTHRFALAFLFPHFYAAHDWVGYVGLTAVGGVGWLTFFGEKTIRSLKESAFVKEPKKAFADLHQSVGELLMPSSKKARNSSLNCTEKLRDTRKN